MQPIIKLDTQLANQIAAGEVVERPASVVKELLENSLDAGARRIDIEITAGGCGLIRIRDDGFGIPKEQLKLALSPHATSKISSLDDLEVIRSFGFRGEALSSISSVSRFTLSSRTIGAEQGWQAEAQGRDMQVKLTPVATAEGTRVEVRELFFNTPARRRFLRTEKTEYSHIEDVVRKIALANFEVVITLKHNNRMSRRYRSAGDLQQQEQRVAAVCGAQFMQRSIRLDLEHEGIELKGWLALPDYHRSQTDGQYFYVNNRSVRDKVLNHAIRQAYQHFIPEGRVPAYVLYLIIDPRKIDVNVHPTKHEVRFHNARLIHDLLVQAIERGLAEGKELIDNALLESNHENLPVTTSSGHWPKYSSSGSGNDTAQHQAYRSLLQSVNHPTATAGVAEVDVQSNFQVQGWHYLTRLNSKFVLLEKADQLVLLSVSLLLKQRIDQHKHSDEPAFQKLLFPEIIQCKNAEESELLSSTFKQFDVMSIVAESQLTILQTPHWMTALPIKNVCLELVRVYTAVELSMQSSAQGMADLIECLLMACDDLAALQLKYIAMDKFPELFQ